MSDIFVFTVVRIYGHSFLVVQLNNRNRPPSSSNRLGPVAEYIIWATNGETLDFNWAKLYITLSFCSGIGPSKKIFVKYAAGIKYYTILFQQHSWNSVVRGEVTLNWSGIRANRIQLNDEITYSHTSHFKQQRSSCLWFALIVQTYYISHLTYEKVTRFLVCIVSKQKQT